MKKRLVIVHWQDIECTSGWQDASDKSLPILKTCGLFISRTRGVLRIGSTYDHINKKWADVNEFPVGCVIQMDEIMKVEL